MPISERIARFRRPLRLILFAMAIVSLLLGLWVTVGHLREDPLADVRAYYDAGARLNRGEPLYPADADTNKAEFYRYPPLLAIVFRPLALLPYDVAAVVWGAAMIVAFLLTVRRIRWTPATRYALAFLSLSIGWSLAIGQAQSLVTLLMALGSPLTVAVAANLKVFPALVGIYWLARREWRPFIRLVGWGLALLAAQLVVEPAGTVAFLSFSNLEQVGRVNNLSPYAISPLLWAALVVVLAVAAIRAAPTRWGWPAAVALSVLATPRLLSYQLMTLLAALRTPGQEAERTSTDPPH